MIMDLTNAEYHARPEVSNSQLKLIGKSPAHFFAGFSGINPDVARKGTAIHSVILENGNNLISLPEDGPARQSKADRQWWCDYFKSELKADIEPASSAKEWFPEIERQTGKTIVTAAEMAEFNRMLESVNSNEDAVRLLADTIAEQSIIGELNGVPFRTRTDAVKPGTIVDIKSCRDASEWAFARDVAQLGYHRQDYCYSEMHHNEYKTWPEFAFVAIEKSEPYPCAVYVLSERAKQNGAMLVERDLETYLACVKSGVWPGYANNFSLDIPIYDNFETVDNFEDLVI